MFANFYQTALATIAIALSMSNTALCKELGQRKGGGSNHIYYRTDDCHFFDFPVLRDYAAHRELIDSQLSTMFANGQRRLRISCGPRCINPKTIEVDLKNFLITFRQIGFEEIEVVFGTVEPLPAAEGEWDEALYQRNWNRIVRIRRVLEASGIPYWLDLLNESVPAANQQGLLRYVRRQWIDYTTAFDTDHTVGFSIIPDAQQDRFAQLRTLYGDNPPTVFDLHFYKSSFASFLNAHKRMQEIGYGNIPWIIGEAFYNDEEEASELARAIRETKQPVLYLTQWPLTRLEKCQGVDAVPLEFNAYQAAGF